ncbi:ribonuclease Z [Lachnospiraceae bacterium 47-T17]
MVDAVLLGISGMRPLPGRGLSSFLIRYEEHVLLFDCGEGTQVNFLKSGVNLFSIECIFITHLHADHVLGFPGIISTLMNLKRRKPLKVFGPTGTKETCLNLLGCFISGGRKIPFDIEFYEYHNSYVELEFSGYVIQCYKVDHTVPCFGYTFKEIRPSYFDKKKIESVLPEECWGPLQSGHTVEYNGDVYTRHKVFGPDRQGIKITFVTDTRPTSIILRNAENSDLLVLEGMYVGNGDDGQKEKNKHMTMIEAATIAKKANAEELWLTHFSPTVVVTQELLKVVDGIFPNSVLGKECLRRTLRHADIIPRIEVRTAFYNRVISGSANSVFCNAQLIREGMVFKIVEISNNNSFVKRSVRATAVSVISENNGSKVLFNLLE